MTKKIPGQLQQTSIKILIADDETSITEGLSDLLQLEGYDTTVASDGEQAIRCLESDYFNIILADLKMPVKSGLEVLQWIKQKDLATEVIIITGQGSIDTAVDAMRSGAYDYITKPVNPKRLKQIVPKVIEKQQLVHRNRELENELRQLSGYGEMVGRHEKMKEVYQTINAVADTTASVFITGESGTGKELVARAIHDLSNRKKAPFIAMNCSAFPRDILENELFGHEKGAFTGALNQKAGCFEMADRGTLFLDEIGEMPADTQSKLLRVLEEQRFRRLGGTSELSVDVRVIAATNRDLQAAISDGLLREDLYYRLAVMDIHLPPLRERISDLQLLLDSFLNTFNQRNHKKIKGFSASALDTLRNHAWPGNIREVRNSVERAVILCKEEYIDQHHLPKNMLNDKKQDDTSSGDIVGRPLQEVEKDLILKTLESTGNNKTKAAKILQISLKTMHNKLNKYLVD